MTEPLNDNVEPGHPPNHADARQALCAQLTPTGRGAIASLGIRGPQAAERVSVHLQLPRGAALADQPVGKILLGRWRQSGGEQVVVCRRSNDDVELHCHGGQAVVEMLADDLVAAGCRRVEWQQFEAATASDPIRAAARVALADAKTYRTAARLYDQYQGALSEAIRQVCRLLDEGTVDQACKLIQSLLGWADLGLHLVRPWSIVLAGRPNVGKSSLINALVGYQRSIVLEQPGTTRDVVTTATAFDGWPVELADTAGLRFTDDPLEAAGVEQARRRFAQADRRVLVFDASQPWSEEDQSLVEAWPDALRIHNKVDQPVVDRPLRPHGVDTSARDGHGMDELTQEIAQLVVPNVPGPGTAIPITEEIVTALELAGSAIDNANVQQAAAELRRLL